MSNPRWNSKFQVKPGSWVYVPSPDSVKRGKEIKKEIESKWKIPNYYYHLRNGGHVSAIKAHLSNDFFLHLDIKDFFGQVNKSKISRCLRPYLGYDRAREIAIESTVISHDKTRYKLPFGFVQSPILASLCLRYSKLGKLLHRYNKQDDISVSVYVDDLILSGNNLEELENIKSKLVKASEYSGFPFNKDKEEGPCTEITAFNVVIAKTHIKISKERFQSFKDEYLYADNDNVKNGILGYVSTINKNQRDVIEGISI